jgi:hypothetical protein
LCGWLHAQQAVAVHLESGCSPHGLPGCLCICCIAPLHHHRGHLAAAFVCRNALLWGVCARRAPDAATCCQPVSPLQAQEAVVAWPQVCALQAGSARAACTGRPGRQSHPVPGTYCFALEHCPAVYLSGPRVSVSCAQRLVAAAQSHRLFVFCRAAGGSMCPRPQCVCKVSLTCYTCHL